MSLALGIRVSHSCCMLRSLLEPVVLVFVGFVVLNRRLESRLETFLISATDSAESRIRRKCVRAKCHDAKSDGTTIDVAMKEIERQNFRRGNRA